MGWYQLRFVVCTLCIILQFHMSIQEPNTVEIRIPSSSIISKNSAFQNQQYRPSYPYPYYTQLSQYYANLCNSCNNFLCNRCSNNNPIKLNSPPRRLTLIIDNRSSAAPNATDPAPTNGDTPPADDQQAPPVTPESDAASPKQGSPPASAPPSDSPPASAPPQGSPPASAPPADAPPQGSPPANAPPADDPPPDSPPATAPPADGPPPDSSTTTATVTNVNNNS